MDGNNVEVRIVGDASGVKPAADQAVSSVSGIKGAIAGVSDFLKTATVQFGEFGLAGAKAGAEVVKAAASATAAVDMETNAVTRMIMKVHEGAESVRTFQMRAKEFAEIYVGIFAVEGIIHWAEKLGEAAHQTEMLSATLGMSVPQVQALAGAAQLSGINMETLSRAITLLNAKTTEAEGKHSSMAKALHAVGISSTDGRTSLERLYQVADKFHGMEDGPQKMALAYRLFGRNVQEILPFLNQGSAAIKDLEERSKELGAVNEKAVEQGSRLQASVNESKVAWTGLLNIITEALGPTLTEVVDGFIGIVKAMKQSYDAGGLVKVIFEAIADTVHMVIEVFVAVGEAISEVFRLTKDDGDDWSGNMEKNFELVTKAIKVVIAAFPVLVLVVKDAFNFIKARTLQNYADWIEWKESVQAKVHELGEVIMLFAKVADEALHLRWGSIVSDWRSGLQQIDDEVVRKGHEIVQHAQQIRDQANQALNQIGKDNAGMASWLDQFMKPMGTLPHDAFKFKFGGGSGDVPDISPGGKEKKPKDDLVQRLEEELELKKVAWEKEQLAQGTAQQYSLESERDFWAQALARTDLSNKDRLEISKKWIAAAQAVQKQDLDQKFDGYKRELAEADKNEQAKLAILQREQAEKHRIYGDGSKEAIAADDAVYQQEKRAAEQRIRLAEETSRQMQAAQQDYVTSLQQQANFEVELGVETKGQLLRQERQFEQQRYQIDLSALLQRRALIDPNRDPEQYQKINGEIEALERKHQLTLTDIDHKAALERTKYERQAINDVASAWGQAIGQMLTFQKSFASTVKALWQGLQQAIGNAIAGIVQDYLTKTLSALLIHKTQHMAATKGEIAGEAAKAGAAGVASWAMAPWPIDAGAPAFGASMFSAAMAYEAVPGWDVGAWGLGRDQIGMVHTGENIIPAGIAGDMREFFGKRADTPNAGNDNGGDTHLHFHGDIIGSEAAMRRWARENRHMFGAGARAFIRMGGNTDPYRRD